MIFEAFNTLSPAVLRALANALRDGVLAESVSYHPILQITGTHADAVFKTAKDLQQQGMTPQQIGLMVTAIAETRECIPDPSLVFDLVLSGPSLANIPTRHTAAVVRSLFADARQEVLVAGYAIYNGEEIFGPLHERMLAESELSVRLFFDIPRRPEHLKEQEIVGAFAREFSSTHWPWPERPELFFYPRSLESTPGNRGSLHAKCVVVDRRTALITSANFTEAAQQRNIEAGILIKYEPMVGRLNSYFDGLVQTGQVRNVPLT